MSSLTTYIWHALLLCLIPTSSILSADLNSSKTGISKRRTAKIRKQNSAPSTIDEDELERIHELSHRDLELSPARCPECQEALGRK